MKVSPARAAAFDILLRGEVERAFTSALLPVFEDRLAGRDRGLCHELVLGTLRRQMWLDRVIQAFAGSKRLDVEVRIALRLGAYQLTSLDRIPAHSAINESVELVRRARKVSATGLVNAVLRKLAAATPELSYADEIERLSVEHSHPRWLVDRWVGQLGAESAEQLLVANNTPPPTAFRTIGNVSPAGAALVETSTPSPYVDGCFRLTDNGAVAAELHASGGIYIQDEGSQLVASTIVTEPDGRALDVCAAPGGKTGMIAMKTPGLLAAGDIHWPRVMLLRENCARQKVSNVATVQYDATVPLPFEASSFDAVLVDAPCTGTGTIRHNPELRYFVSPEDLNDLPEKQLSILLNAAETVRPGGQLVYSTCSLEPEENEAVVGQFLTRNRNFSAEPLVVHDRFLTPDGFARTWPHRDAMDGFFIATFRSRDADK